MPPRHSVRIADNRRVNYIARAELIKLSEAVDEVSSTEIFERFIVAINDHDVGPYISLKTRDHVFVDLARRRAQPSGS